MRRIVLLLPLVFWACSGPTSPDRPPTAPAAIVSIDTIPAIAGHYVKVPVRLSYDSTSPVDITDLGVIDLLLTYDDSLLTFIQAERGDAIDEWEYFTYRSSLFRQQESDRKHVQVVIRRNMADGIDPDPPQSKPEGALAWLTFFVSNEYHPEGTRASIGFWLRECGNNVLQSDDDTSCVYLPDPTAGNPVVESIYDAGDCSGWGEARANDVEQTVKLQGGVIKLVESLPPVYGDLDLDGAGFGESDLALYRSYFLHGFEVWNPATLTRQIAQSDMNRDGEPLTLADYEYLRTRMVEGEDIDTIPIHPYSRVITLFPDTSVTGQLELAVLFGARTSLIWLHIEGVKPESPAPIWQGSGEVTIDYAQQGDVMKVLLEFTGQSQHGVPLPRLHVQSGEDSRPRLIAYQASTFPGEPLVPQVGRLIGPFQ